MNARVTIRDVARRAGVSAGTVSNVLARRVAVSDDLRARVLEAATALEYQPDTNAQSLRRRHSRLIGLVTSHTTSSYFAALIDAFEDIAALRDHEVVQVLSRHDPAVEKHRLRALVAHKPAGVILVPSEAPQASLDLLAEAQIPTVVVDRHAADDRFDYVTVDNRGAMRALAGALVERGHHTIILAVTYPTLVTTRQRIDTLRQVAAGAGVEARVLLRGPSETDFAPRLVEAIGAAATPAALIASNSLVALWAARTLRRAGIAVPAGVSLASFDEPDWAEIVTPPLAIVRQPTGAIARTAWELLMRRIAGADAPRTHVELPATLVLRESVGDWRAAPRVRGL